MTGGEYLKALLKRVWKEISAYDWKQEVCFPLVIREGVNRTGKRVIYYLNYSRNVMKVTIPFAGEELFTEKTVTAGAVLDVNPWDLLIICCES